MNKSLNYLKKHKIPVVILCLFSLAYFSRYYWLPESITVKKSHWQTIIGKKTPSFLPEVQMRYGPADDCGRGELNTIIPAKEGDNGKTYTIRYPLHIDYKGCLYSTGGAKLYMEEKNDDPRLKNDPDYGRGKSKRLHLVAGSIGGVTNVLFASNDYVDKELDPSRSFVDISPLDIYCYRTRKVNPVHKMKMTNSLYCGTSAGQKKPLMFIYYSQRFVQSGKPVVINLKVSQKTYCRKAGKNYCDEKGETDLPQIPRNFRDFITPDWFAPFYEEDNPNAR